MLVRCRVCHKGRGVVSLLGRPVVQSVKQDGCLVSNCGMNRHPPCAAQGRRGQICSAAEAARQEQQEAQLSPLGSAIVVSQ